MSLRVRTAFILVTLLAAHACAPRRPSVGPETTADANAIRAAFAAWVRTAEAGDAAGYGRYITDDFVFLGPGARPRVGKSTVLPWVERWFADWQFTFPQWTTEEVIVVGDLAIHRYSGVATLTPKKGGAPITADRKYIDIVRREADGQWRVARHMFNLNR